MSQHCFGSSNRITDAQLRSSYAKFLPEMRPMFTISNQLWIEWSVKQPFTFLGYFHQAVFLYVCHNPSYNISTHIHFLHKCWSEWWWRTYFDIQTFQRIRELLYKYITYKRNVLLYPMLWYSLLNENEYIVFTITTGCLTFIHQHFFENPHKKWARLM